MEDPFDNPETVEKILGLDTVQKNLHPLLHEINAAPMDLEIILKMLGEIQPNKRINITLSNLLFDALIRYERIKEIVDIIKTSENHDILRTCILCIFFIKNTPWGSQIWHRTVDREKDKQYCNPTIPLDIIYTITKNLKEDRGVFDQSVVNYFKGIEIRPLHLQ